MINCTISKFTEIQILKMQPTCIQLLTPTKTDGCLHPQKLQTNMTAHSNKSHTDRHNDHSPIKAMWTDIQSLRTTNYKRQTQLLIPTNQYNHVFLSSRIHVPDKDCIKIFILNFAFHILHHRPLLCQKRNKDSLLC